MATNEPSEPLETVTEVRSLPDEEKGVHKTQTGITMSPELFEKLYLTPKVPRAGDYNKRFANPTPLGFLGFILPTFTYAMVCMGFGGAKGLTPVVGMFFFVGPVLLTFAMVFEWIMGNFFPMMVMGMFAVFWLSFGMLELPTLQLGLPYASSDDPTGLASREFNAVIAIYLIVWGFALFTFFVFTCKINVVFAAVFLIVSIAVWVLSGAYWMVSWGNYAAAVKLQKTGGALLFVDAVLGWYMCFNIMAEEMRMNLRLPVGDLSHLWPKTDVEMAATERREHQD